jgi:hypothetical protein
MTEESKFDSQQGQEIDFFSIKSKPALGPTQLSIQWVPESVFPGVKQQRSEADRSPPSNAEVKNGGVMPPLANTSSWRDA